MLTGISVRGGRRQALARLQRGMTLMEMIASLSVMAVVIVGALALFGSATSSESAVTMNTDLGALKSAARELFNGQGSYGTSGTDLNSVLVLSKKVPTTITVGGTTAAPTFTYRDVGIDVQSTGSSFTVGLTNVPSDLCVALLTAASGWTSVTDPSGTVNTTFPVSPATANTGCASAGSMTFTN